jgi:hypothetical protein
MTDKKKVFSKEKWKQRIIELGQWDENRQMKYNATESWLNDLEGKTVEEAEKMLYRINENWLVEVDA